MEWKRVYIEGQETYYLINENGEVKSEYTNKILTPTFNKGRGYFSVYLRLNGKTHTKTVHRLVAEAFIPNPLKLEQVNHIDGVKTNNKLTNLEWCSRSENIKHAYDTGLKKAAFEQIKRKVLQYSLDGEYIRSFDTIKEASEFLGRTNAGPNIGRACSGQRQSAYGYKWKYGDDRRVWFEL